MNDWRLRNRIRAFILLIQRSAFRESLKGQDQLHIDPLMDLIDRFHTHEATDTRDKIFALWGLSTESELTSILQPDYNKSWKSLLAELGLYVFGKDSELTPSESKQMLHVRSLCYYLGKVVTIYNAEMWDMEQRLEIASLQVSKFLDHGGIYNLTLKMRSSAEKICEGDIICFLPHTRNLIFARPESHFLRIISIIESRSVQTSTHMQARNKYWVSWQPFLDCIDDEMMEVSFLWSWEQDTMREGEEKWCLMRNHSPGSISPANNEAHYVLEAKILTEMATLHMSMDNYAAACLNISTVLDADTLGHGLEPGGIVNSRECLDIALSRRSMYDKAKNILASRKHNNVDTRSPGVKDLCFHVICHAGMELVLEKNSEGCIREYIQFRSMLRFTDAHIWVEFAAVIMSQGIRKNMILDAIRMCDLDWDKLRKKAAQAMERSDLLDGIGLLPQTSDPHNDYLGFLSFMSDEHLRLSTIELGIAFRADVSARNLNLLLQHCETTVDNLPDLIESVWGRTELNDRHKSSGTFLESVLKGNADRVSITYDTILSACRYEYDHEYDQGTVPALLKAAKEGRSITSLTLDKLVRHPMIPGYVVRDFANITETEWHIGEDALLTIFGYHYEHDRLQKDLIAFLENEKVTIIITQPVLEQILELELERGEEVISLLMYRQDPPLVNGETIMPKRVSTKVWKTRMLPNLRLLQEGARPFEKGHITLTIPKSVCGYVQLLNLIRYRRAELEITADLFLRMTVHKPAREENLSFVIIEKIGRCMIRYADDKEVDALIESSEFLNAIAAGGYVPMIEDLRSRMKNVSPLFEVFSQVTIWSRATMVKGSLRQYHGSQTHRELIKSLETMFVPPQLQRTLLKLACSNLGYTEKYDILEDILSRNIIKALLSLKFQETILRLVLRPWSSSTALNTLLKHKVIGANTAFEDGSTTLHLLFSWSVSDEAERIAKNVDIVMQHGGAASIDAKNARGKTPRKMVKEIIKRETKEGNYHGCEYFSMILRTFDRRTPMSSKR